MTFCLARPNDWTVIVAALAVVTIVVSCEHPVTDPSSLIAQLVVSPPNVTLQQNHAEDFLAVGFTASGDSADIAVSWSATGGSIDSSSAGKRHYGHYTSATCGTFTVTATSHPGNVSTAASVTVTGCPLPVASVSVTPATATIGVGQTAQYAAITRDAFGNPLGGRTVTWSSSNPAVATVNGAGQATGVAVGAATITATSEGKSGTAAITVSATAPLPAGSCQTGSAVWVSSPFSTQNGSFTVQFDATPNAAPMDGVMGLSAGPTTLYEALAVTVRFNPAGQIDARSGAVYTAANAIPYAAGTSYRFRFVVDIPSHTFAAYVTPSGSAELTVGTGLAFRTDQPPVSALDNWALHTESGTDSVCNFSVSSSTPQTPVAPEELTPPSPTLQAGRTVQPPPTLKDANGNTLTGRTVTWASSNPAVATVTGSGLVSGVTAGAATITATSETVSGTSAVTVTAPPPPGSSQFGHVFIVTEENTDYADVTTSSMPYLMGLAAQYGLATQYYANTHPSIGNYFELATGQILTNDDGSSTIENVPNVVRSLVAAGKTWKSYAESIPSACYLGGDTGDYARKHNVFALLSDVANDPSGQACNIVPFTQFAIDLTNGTLPSFSNIVPNLCNDSHDCGLNVADSWLQTNIAPLIASPVFQQDGLLIIVFDESGGDNTNGGGRIVWVAVSPKAKRGYQSTTLYQHQSTLRLILEGLGVSALPGAAATAPDMEEFFNR